METEPGSAAGTSWLARHPLIVIGVLLAACLGPFLNQAIQTDDTLFVWTAQWIEKHPLDFFGFKVNWWSSAIPMWMANWNPPLWPYLLAGAGGLLGWNEIVLHSVGFVLAFVAAAGVYRLAWMWSEQPLLATAIAILTPAFFILSTTLMCDVTMCACWIWTVVIWERASANDESRWQFVGAGVVAGLAVLAKYSAITLLPLLAVFCLARRSNLAWKLAGLAVPVAMIAGYEWMTGRMYGHGLLSLASYYARADRFGFQGGWQAKGIIGLTFVGGSLLPLLFLAPWLWRFRTWTTSGLLLLGLLLGWFWLRGDPGLMHPWVDADGYLMKLWDFRLQVLLLTLAGLHVLLLAVAEMWQRRDRIAFLLVCWIGGVVFFATVLNWTVNARSFLPAVPAAAILAVRRLSARSKQGGRWLSLPIGAAAVAVISLAVANWQLANSGRTAATLIAARYKTPDHNLWFDGHSGFQYYMEQAGALPLDIEQSLLLPGDFVAASLIGHYVVLPPGGVGVVNDVKIRLYSWVNLQARGARTAAGFYTSDSGPIPFALGAPQPQEYFVLKVFSRLQYQSQPANPQDVLAGAVPSFTNSTYAEEESATLAENPAATEQIKAAGQLLMAGQEAAAAERYQAALAIQSNNPTALSRLAWILATASEPGLRDQRKAVQLASLAVKQSDARHAAMIVVLATAYAADGQFAKARTTAGFARNLALLTGQAEVAASCERLIRQCAGK